MVKIIEKTNEEKMLEKKVKDFISITSKITDEKITDYFDLLTIGDILKISVNLEGNRVGVYDEKYFSLAKSLAEKYEEYTKDEWDLKKRY
jgi:hypothetical protein